MKTQIIELVQPIVLAIIAWASLHVANWIRTETKNAKIRGILTFLSDAVFTVVRSTEQTTVATLKAQSGFGLTKAEGVAVREEALAALKKYLGENGLKEIALLLGISDLCDSDKQVKISEYLTSKIEAEVSRIPTPASLASQKK